MPHADASLVPSTIITKSRSWDHVHSQLEPLLAGQRHWVLRVTNLANACSLIYNSLLAFPAYFGSDDRAVNWCGEPRRPCHPDLVMIGFYILPSLFPLPRFTTPTSSQPNASQGQGLLASKLTMARGVCADAFIHGQTVLVRDVNTYPGHIACDGSTNSEIVCPLIYQGQESDERFVVGVLDLDCLALSGFDEDDQSELIVRSCDW
ncbi:hypothetical protein F5141DRAFT_1187016 [Pisolithus sp. B1]|nr:hypothetical protein F5141DRAFT_1187016 [Pisolithus sp. B1]